MISTPSTSASSIISQSAVSVAIFHQAIKLQHSTWKIAVAFHKEVTLILVRVQEITK